MSIKDDPVDLMAALKASIVAARARREEAEATRAHSEGVSNECLAGRCANCWNDECACPYCGHPDGGKRAS